ncbi:MAG: DMT family transporter [Gammaproteobacteria bacterium]
MPSNHSSTVSSSALPVVSLLLGATLWGIFWYPMRLLEQNGIPGLWSSLIMYMAAVVISLPWLWRQRSALIKRPGLLLALGLSAGWCNVAFILAIIDGNVMRVLLLFYLAPLWAALLGRFMLGERLSPRAWATMGLAMCGALIMLWQLPSRSLNSETFALESSDWLAISSGFMFALSNVLVRKAWNITIAVKTIVVWWGGLLLAGLWIVLSASPLPELRPPIVAAAIALGGFGIMIMTVAVQYGVTHMPVHRSAVILLFELVAGAVSSQLLSDEVIQVNEWLGGVLIITAAYFSALPEESKYKFKST